MHHATCHNRLAGKAKQRSQIDGAQVRHGYHSIIVSTKIRIFPHFDNIFMIFKIRFSGKASE
jgi:hypothetical protein